MQNGRKTMRSTLTACRAELLRTAHHQPIDAQGGLAHTNRYALTFLAASAHAIVKRHVVAHHLNFRERLWAVTDQGCTLEWVSDFAVFNFVGQRS